MRISEIVVAVFFFLIAIYFIIYDVLNFFGLVETYRSLGYEILSKLLFIFGIASGILMIKDALAKQSS
jgi:hypothetical protein